jgi:hypothetical protein
MGLLALELNDAGLLSSTGEDWRDEGPGYALLDPDRLLLGAEARAESRLRPRRLNRRFWARLDTAPLAQPTALAGSHADLACAQLDAIWRRRPIGADALLLVAPAFLGREALGLSSASPRSSASLSAAWSTPRSRPARGGRRAASSRISTWACTARC